MLLPVAALLAVLAAFSPAAHAVGGGGTHLVDPDSQGMFGFCCNPTELPDTLNLNLSGTFHNQPGHQDYACTAPDDVMPPPFAAVGTSFSDPLTFTCNAIASAAAVGYSNQDPVPGTHADVVPAYGALPASFTITGTYVLTTLGGFALAGAAAQAVTGQNDAASATGTWTFSGTAFTNVSVNCAGSSTAYGFSTYAGDYSWWESTGPCELAQPGPA